jgi:hypothetical protein
VVVVAVIMRHQHMQAVMGDHDSEIVALFSHHINYHFCSSSSFVTNQLTGDSPFSLSLLIIPFHQHQLYHNTMT